MLIGGYMKNLIQSSILKRRARMKGSLYFNNIKGVGSLYLESVFYEFEYEPVIFLCKDDNNILYFCLCTEIRYEQKWLLRKIELSELELLAKKKLDIKSFFEKEGTIIVITLDCDNIEKNDLVKTSEIDELDLPEEGVYIQCNSEDIIEYIESVNDKKKKIGSSFDDIIIAYMHNHISLDKKSLNKSKNYKILFSNYNEECIEKTSCDNVSGCYSEGYKYDNYKCEQVKVQNNFIINNSYDCSIKKKETIDHNCIYCSMQAS